MCLNNMVASPIAIATLFLLFSDFRVPSDPCWAFGACPWNVRERAYWCTTSISPGSMKAPSAYTIAGSRILPAVPLLM